MDENNRVHAAPSSKTHPPRQQYVPYQRNVHHITQDPIVDDSVAHAAPAGPGVQTDAVPQPGATVPPAQAAYPDQLTQGAYPAQAAQSMQAEQSAQAAYSTQFAQPTQGAYPAQTAQGSQGTYPAPAGQPAPMAQPAPAEPYYEPPVSAGQPRGTMPGRKHMGVATSDPQYLQPAGAVGGRAGGPAHPRHKNPGDGEPQTLHGNRYLSTPSSHKTIFTARQDRARKRIRVLLVVLLLVVIAVVVWLIFFH